MTSVRPGRRVSMIARSRAKVTPVDRAVQPLRSSSTDTMPIAKGTAVTISTAYHVPGLNRPIRVTTRAASEPTVVVRQSTAIVSKPARSSAAATMTSA